MIDLFFENKYDCPTCHSLFLKKDGVKCFINYTYRHCDLAIVSGSFNPLHEGHLKLAEEASKFLNRPVAFELSIDNADKPSLSKDEALRRCVQFIDKGDILLTYAPTFEQKAVLFPKAVFVIGADTAVRVVNPKFYDNSLEKMTAAMDKIRAVGCSFLVADRNGLSLDGLSLKEDTDQYKDLFTRLPNFQCDVSSTQIRRICNESV